MMNEDQLGEFIGQHFTRDLFRLETRERYNVESDGEDLRRFLRGESNPAAPGKAEWLEHVREEARTGLVSRRVNVLRAPLSDYQRYECEWGYTYLVEAGEQIRVLDLTHRAEHGHIRAIGDFFLIDNTHVLRMIYDNDDRFVGAETVAAADTKPYQQIADAAWTLAEPFTAWWASHPEHHRGRAVA